MSRPSHPAPILTASPPERKKQRSYTSLISTFINSQFRFRLCKQLWMRGWGKSTVQRRRSKCKVERQAVVMETESSEINKTGLQFQFWQLLA